MVVVHFLIGYFFYVSVYIYMVVVVKRPSAIIIPQTNTTGASNTKTACRLKLLTIIYLFT